jgi:osmotically-inducible protein OsmY
MKSNETLQKNVQDAIKWEPLLHAAEIGVTAKDGVVTLSGVVDSYSKKIEAENAAKNVAGVQALVEKIEIKFDNIWSKGDNEIAAEILTAFKWNWEVPNDKIKIKVENGWVTLSGTLPWNFQKDAAKKSVHNIIGVRGITNVIEIKSETHDDVEKKDIQAALARNWSINDRDIHVKVAGNGVTLSGKVSSWYQKEEAGRIAWNAPGVWTVDNQLVIEYDYVLVG